MCRKRYWNSSKPLWDIQLVTKTSLNGSLCTKSLIKCNQSPEIALICRPLRQQGRANAMHSGRKRWKWRRQIPSLHPCVRMRISHHTSLNTESLSLKEGDPSARNPPTVRPVQLKLRLVIIARNIKRHFRTRPSKHQTPSDRSKVKSNGNIWECRCAYRLFGGIRKLSGFSQRLCKYETHTMDVTRFQRCEREHSEGSRCRRGEGGEVV